MTYIENILKLIAENELHDYVYWDIELNFYVNCDDLFYWGCTDREPVTEESLVDFEKAISDSKKNPVELYCARRRGMRPQRPYYKYFTENEAEQFDACGPERDQ